MTYRQLAATAALALLAACGNDGDGFLTDGLPTVTVNPVTIVAVPGDTVRLGVSTSGYRAPVQVAYSASSNASITVDAGGLVTATAPGSAVVTITVATKFQTVTSSVPVTVLGLSVEPKTLGLASFGGAFRLVPTTSGPASAIGSLVWSSSDTTVAIVDPDGTVRARQPGIARIAVASSAFPRLRAEVVVTSLCTCTAVQSLTVAPGAITLQTGATQQIAATVTLGTGAPASTSTAVAYVSSDTMVAVVSPTGLVTGRRNGTAVITVASVAAPTITQQIPVTVRGGPLRAAFQSITTGDPPAPVDLGAVRGRIRVTVNVAGTESFGAFRGAELWLAGRRAASLDSVTFVKGEVTPLTMEIDTAARDPQTNARLYPNGEAVLEFRIRFAVPGATSGQEATLRLPLTLANP